jgi:hypothetical protein
MGFKQRRPRIPNDQRATVNVNFNLPRGLHAAIDAKADSMQMPLGRVISWAVDNELMKGKDAFRQLWEYPQNVFVEGSYVDEGRKVFQYLNKFGPMSIDQLVLQRRDVGVFKKEELLLGIREIIERKTLVDLVRPSKATTFRYPEEYRLLRPREALDEKRRKEIKNLRERLANLEGKSDAEEES